VVIAKHFVVEITAKARRVLKPIFDYAPIIQAACGMRDPLEMLLYHHVPPCALFSGERGPARALSLP
jgi:hypothetical protein